MFWFNGECIFVCGMNYISMQWFSEMDCECFCQDVMLMCEVNINVVCVYVYVELCEFY